jgi:hypothetical protein
MSMALLKVDVLKYMFKELDGFGLRSDPIESGVCLQQESPQVNGLEKENFQDIVHASSRVRIAHIKASIEGLDPNSERSSSPVELDARSEDLFVSWLAKGHRPRKVLL